ncbi:MAG: hypothetical protein GKR90_00740 [Pseudomonadales bacterium]|nr:hypothetical protein [Pseudomonadales bacterium]
MKMTNSQSNKSILITSIVTVGLLFGAASANADRGDRHFDRNRGADKPNYQRDDQRYRDNHRYDNKRDRRHYARGDHYRGERIKLDLPVRVRGTDRIALRKLAKRYHEVNLKNYHLVRVVVDGRSRRYDPGTVRLRVGKQFSREKYLDGRTAIHAPFAHRKAHWVLDVNRGRVNNVRLVLEPRKRQYSHRRGGRNSWDLAFHGNFPRAW